jgi:polyribonucleotide nucleotidyltransferase
MESMEIEGKYIGAIIGPAGKVIQEMQKETETTINIKEENDIWVLSEIAGTGRARLKRLSNESETSSWNQQLEIHHAEKMLDCGAVEFKPGKETLLHVSEFDYKRIRSLQLY